MKDLTMALEEVGERLGQARQHVVQASRLAKEARAYLADAETLRERFRNHGILTGGPDKIDELRTAMETARTKGNEAIAEIDEAVSAANPAGPEGGTDE